MSLVSRRQKNLEQIRKHLLFTWCNTENFQLTAVSQQAQQTNCSILFQYFPFFIVEKIFEFFHLFNLFDFEFVGFQTKWIMTP